MLCLCLCAQCLGGRDLLRVDQMTQGGIAFNSELFSPSGLKSGETHRL